MNSKAVDIIIAAMIMIKAKYLKYGSRKNEKAHMEVKVKT